MTLGTDALGTEAPAGGETRQGLDPKDDDPAALAATPEQHPSQGSATPVPLAEAYDRKADEAALRVHDQRGDDPRTVQLREHFHTVSKTYRDAARMAREAEASIPLAEALEAYRKALKDIVRIHNDPSPDLEAIVQIVRVARAALDAGEVTSVRRIRHSRKITSIGGREPDGGRMIHATGGGCWLPPILFAKGLPKVGDFLVQYADDFSWGWEPAAPSDAAREAEASIPTPHPAPVARPAGEERQGAPWNKEDSRFWDSVHDILERHIKATQGSQIDSVGVRGLFEATDALIEFFTALIVYKDETTPSSSLSRVPASPSGSGDLISYLERQWAWSKETFGPALRTRGIVQHITKELREIEAEPHDLAEWVDVIILAMDGFWRHGGKPEGLLPAMQAKQDRNFARSWPDWRTMGEDQAIEHDRSGEGVSAPTADTSDQGVGITVEEIARVASEAFARSKAIPAWDDVGRAVLALLTDPKAHPAGGESPDTSGRGSGTGDWAEISVAELEAHKAGEKTSLKHAEWNERRLAAGQLVFSREYTTMAVVQDALLAFQRALASPAPAVTEQGDET